MQPDPILQPLIPDAQREAAGRRLPAMQPVAEGALLTVDAGYSAQLAEKARLIAAGRDRVIAVTPGAGAAVAELLEFVLDDLSRRPDGVTVTVERDDPFLTLSRLVQEDLCVLEKRGAEHALTAALLCFPAAWTLAEKIGQPLLRIHLPVPVYDAGIAGRVQRMFDGVQPGRALWRANLLRYDLPDLYQPHSEASPRAVGQPDSPYERSERQSVFRLPVSGAVVFAIHTTVVARAG